MGEMANGTGNISKYPPMRATACAAILICVGLLAPKAKAQNFDAMGQLVVRVRSAGSETPLAQVRVELVKFPSGVVEDQFTGSDGSVQFSSISVGAYTVRATRQGYQASQATVDFRRGDATLQTVDILLLPKEKNGTDSAEGSVSADDLKIPDKARKAFERGKKFLTQDKKPKESIAAFEEAIAAYPEYCDAYFLMGAAQLQIGAFSAAEASLRKAIAIDGHRPGPYYPLAMLLFSQRKYDDEQKLLLDAQKLDPTDWRWTFELARAEGQEGKWEPALQHALQSSKLPKAATKVHLLLGDIYSNTGRTKEAIAELELFIQLDPTSPYIEKINKALPELRRQLGNTSSAQP